ncbi:hypothetical protein [Clostridium tetani]|uniref:hypothetical protein n=1 Tax=Clostridium tetani TaxID=1513 RepID=UPI0024A7BBF4|nr:hypothetical protein [Clostridium tetani]
MVKANKGLVRLILFSLFISLILRSIQIGLGTFDGHYIVDGNLKNGIEKCADDDITIKKEQDFKLGKDKYKLFFSVNNNNHNHCYVNIYKKKLGGIYYEKSLAIQSEKLFNIFRFSCNNKNAYPSIYIIYGYNENFNISDYTIKNKNNNLIKKEVKSEKYFLDLIHTDLIEDIEIKTIDGDNLSDNNINYRVII